ncbi:hypothetical protein HMPREF0762_01714 [Slackia exigua ATCC 700122]|uniref:Uncharacterized protein n=1 Tax=Slackia exigua (strain ATCC 700122 / DSM 15923 / CIP 105133 / JCM 11022 / KCTC 5966 / S-7) TaxID=649764 RepID=D0WIN9_SLAES|nr:hypothetical protein HMPREF0762_01714 [Slackia exigua ATCC 700122]
MANFAEPSAYIEVVAVLARQFASLASGANGAVDIKAHLCHG